MAPAREDRRSPSPAPVRVLLVDDSLFMQRRMTELLEQGGAVKIVGTARDGVDAIRRATELKPDVITMDIHMPRMDGLQAIEHIMRTQPRPIVVVSSFVKSGSAAAIAALEIGAVDLVLKPSESGVSLDISQVAGELVRKVCVAARVRVVRTAACTMVGAPEQPVVPFVRPTMPVGDAGPDLVVLIGCSTGGPAALLQLARQWRGAPLPAMAIAQHLPAGFTGELARQMEERLGLPVREAVPGDRPQAGSVLICPGGRHLAFGPGGAVQFGGTSPEDRWVPSIDRMFESAAAAYGARALGVVLTGMGSDGTIGASSIRRAGGSVWAQDEETSIIDGMPKSVREAGLASRVLPLHAIGQELMLAANAVHET